MESKHFRIGNLLNHSELGIVEVIAVGKEYIHCIFNGETFYENIRRFSPIPLTEEWLNKFGFFYSESLEMYLLKIQKEKWLCWSKEKGITMQDVNKTLFEYKKIKYIHQLQNLYFATQQEELKLEQS